MTNARITRRLRGIGFEPDGDGRWVRRDCPPDRKSRRHRRYGWGRGWFIVERRTAGSFTLKSVTAGRFRWKNGTADRDTTDVTIRDGMDLTETIAEINKCLLRQRTSGRLHGWWHLPKWSNT